MRRFIFIIAIFVFTLCGFVERANAQVNVTQEHNNPSRDGAYVDAAFTPSAAANLTRDLNFDGTISGNVYAQPLYIEGRTEWADDYRPDRIEQRLRAQCHNWLADLAAKCWHAGAIRHSMPR